LFKCDDIDILGMLLNYKQEGEEWWVLWGGLWGPGKDHQGLPLEQALQINHWPKSNSEIKRNYSENEVKVKLFVPVEF
jgi:hypothetical protein